MTRTNIDIDDRLIKNVMQQFGVKTKREAVELALRQAYVEPMTIDEALAMEGTGWGDGELELEDVRPGYQPWDEQCL